MQFHLQLYSVEGGSLIGIAVDSIKLNLSDLKGAQYSMRSPWGESNYRNDDDRSNGYDRGGSGSINHGLLGSLIERSTSAPPLSSESGLSFGDGNSGVSLLDLELRY